MIEALAHSVALWDETTFREVCPIEQACTGKIARSPCLGQTLTAIALASRVARVVHDATVMMAEARSGLRPWIGSQSKNQMP